MRDWKVDSAMYRGGGNFADAMRLLSDARMDPPIRLLNKFYTLQAARDVLGLPGDLAVPDGPESCVMKNFNNDATSGPLLFAFGCKKKLGLGGVLSDFMWNLYDKFGDGAIGEKGLPFFTGRVGFRSKLVPFQDAVGKLKDGKAIGRCVVMLDALEQAASTPLYNVLTGEVYRRVRSRYSGFRNTVVRASTDWINFWDEIKEAKVIVELDWKKFDRERPAEDLQFCIDVFISCFQPKTVREERLLQAYAICMRRALVERPFITDSGGVFLMDGMVPSGSLWTGFLDTALNILYMADALLDMGFSHLQAMPKCCGDDNLTLFYVDVSDERLMGLKRRLNEYYRAGIDDEDFSIRRPPFHVITEQACFPPGTDLGKGTSHLLDQANWVKFDEEIKVDQAMGLSHRWRYNFFGKPKFLSCYWLETGLPIRPAKQSLEKLLFPESIQGSIDDYEAGILAMVVDNPFNHHNINHLKHRYIIVQQVKRYAVLGIDPFEVIRYSRVRPKGDEPVPFPMVAWWRRQGEYVDLDNSMEIDEYVKDFNSFVVGVTTLYKRASTGGLDAWRFMDLIRGEVSVGSGQWGNDVDAWISFIRDNPATRFLKKTRRYRNLSERVVDSGDNLGRATNILVVLSQQLRKEAFENASQFALYISNVIRESDKSLLKIC